MPKLRVSAAAMSNPRLQERGTVRGLVQGTGSVHGQANWQDPVPRVLCFVRQGIHCRERKRNGDPKMNGQKTIHPVMMQCPHCRGMGKAVNDYHVNKIETCFQCKGKRDVPWEGCATCKQHACSCTTWNECNPRGDSIHYEPRTPISIDYVPNIEATLFA